MANEIEIDTGRAYDTAFDHGIAYEAIRPVGNTKFAILPPGYTAQDLYSENLQKAPHRVRASVQLDDEASFVEYVERFKSPNTCIFAQRGTSTVVAVLDYHGRFSLPELADANSAGDPSWCTHKAILQLRCSDDWKAWSSNNKTWISQVDFAQFLEDNAATIAEPDGATILEAAMNLQAVKTVHFKSALNLANSTTQLQYVEEINGASGAGQITVPTRFVLGLSPFVGGKVVPIPMRLRYKIANSSLSFVYIVERQDQLIEAAFADVLVSIAEKTQIHPLLGSWTPQ